MKDFLEAGLNMKVADNKGAILSKWISITFGAISFLLIFVVRQMDSVLKVSSRYRHRLNVVLEINFEDLLKFFNDARAARVERINFKFYFSHLSLECNHVWQMEKVPLLGYFL